MHKFSKQLLSIVLSIVMLVPFCCTALAACGGDDTPPPEATLQSIELDVSGAKTAFEFGEEFSYEGLKVYAVMSDGTKTEIPLTECRISTPVMTQPGARRVNVTYQGKSASYNITVAERKMPEISKTPVFEIKEGGEGTYSVEAEAIDLAVSGVKAAPDTQLTGEASDPLDDSGETKVKYLGNYGVAGNYFGFTFTADKEYQNVMIGFHVANPSTTENFGLGERMKVYLNYKGVSEPGELNVGGLTTLPARTVSYAEDDAEHQTPIPDEMTWWYRVMRGVTVPAGTNTLTFDVTADGEALCIDRIDFCVDGKYEHVSSITLDDSKGSAPFIQDFEDWDLENVVVREDVANAHHLKKGQVFLEGCNPTDASGRGTSLGAVVAPSEFATRIILAEDATIEPVFIAAAYNAGVRIKNAIDFFIDGVKIETVEDKDISDQTPLPDGSKGFWNWKDTSLGVINLTAGSHEFSFKINSDAGNIDAMKYYVRSWGEFEAEYTELTVKTQPTTLTYTVGDVFDPTGLVLEAHFADESVQEVTEGYTWSPEGKLTLEDKVVTVTYRNKSVEIEITVNEPLEPPYDVKIEGNSDGDHEFIVEAESLNMEGNQLQEGMPADKGFVEKTDPGLASGDACLAAFSHAGNKVKVTFRLEAGATVAIQILMAKYEDTFDFTEKVNFILDDGTDNQKTLPNPGTVAFGHTEENQYYNWKPVEFAAKRLEAGYHTLTLDILSDCPNIDLFKFTVSGYGEPCDAILDDNGEFIAEGENLDMTEWKLRDDQTSFTEECTGSNGNCAKGFDEGSVITVRVYLEAKATVSVTAVLASWEGVTFTAEDWTVTFSGQSVDMAGKTISEGQSTGNFHLWNDVDMGSFELEAGMHELKIIMNGANSVNIDCFKFSVTNYNAGV